MVFDVILRPSLPTSDPPCKPDEMLHSRYGQPAFLFRKAFENFIGGRNSNFRKKPIPCLTCLKRKLPKRRQKSCKENVTIRWKSLKSSSKYRKPSRRLTWLPLGFCFVWTGRNQRLDVKGSEMDRIGWLCYFIVYDSVREKFAWFGKIIMALYCPCVFDCRVTKWSFGGDNPWYWIHGSHKVTVKALKALKDLLSKATILCEMTVIM